MTLEMGVLLIREEGWEMPAEERAGEDPPDWFRLAFEQSPEGLALATPEGRWTEVNATLCRWLGYERDKLLEVCARGHAATLATPFWRYTFKDLIPAGGEEARSVEQRRFELPGRRGEAILLDITVSRLCSASGETLALLGRFADTGESRGRQWQQEAYAGERLRAMQEAAAGATRGHLLLCEEAAQLPRLLPQLAPELALALGRRHEREQDEARLRERVLPAAAAADLPEGRREDLLAAAEAAKDLLLLQEPPILLDEEGEPDLEGADLRCRLRVCGGKATWLQVWFEAPAPSPTDMLDGPSHAWRGVDWMERGGFGGWQIDPPGHVARMLRGADRVWFYPGSYALSHKRVLVLEAFRPSTQPGRRRRGGR